MALDGQRRRGDVADRLASTNLGWKRSGKGRSGRRLENDRGLEGQSTTTTLLSTAVADLSAMNQWSSINPQGIPARSVGAARFDVIQSTNRRSKS